MNKEAEQQPQETSFLVAYDYGQGGVWGYITAPSAEAITERLPELAIVDTDPEWLTEEIKETLPKGHLNGPEQHPLFSELGSFLI